MWIGNIHIYNYEYFNCAPVAQFPVYFFQVHALIQVNA